jgi:hypothetical protein
VWRRVLSGVLEGEGLSRPSSAKTSSRGQHLVASSRSDPVPGNGILPSVGYPGSVAVPRQLQGSGSLPRTRPGPLPGGLQPLGIEGIRDPLGRSGVGERLREVAVLEPFGGETPEPSPRVGSWPGNTLISAASCHLLFPACDVCMWVECLTCKVDLCTGVERVLIMLLLDKQVREVVSNFPSGGLRCLWTVHASRGSAGVRL